MIYEDAAIAAELNNPAAALGHISIKAKTEKTSLADIRVEQASQMFWAASFAATAVFETLGAAGSNIVLRDGQELSMDVFARNPDDSLSLQWEPQPGDRQEVEAVAKKVKDAFWFIGKDDQQPAAQPTSTEVPEPVDDVGEDERIKHLQRRY